MAIQLAGFRIDGDEGPIAGALPIVTKAQGHHLTLKDGRVILDACGGAAVSSIGHGNKEVHEAMSAQQEDFSYISWAHFESDITRNFGTWISESTGGRMAKVYLMSSGSEAIEGAMKLAKEYFMWIGQKSRVNFIAREESYHGTTIGSLGLGGHLARRAPFETILNTNIARVSACNPYRQRLEAESDEDFVARKVAELEDAFTRLGPDTICAFVAEPVVGAASGCTPAVPGYFKAMKAVCDKYGALLILDEVMCGMGRTGTLHAWEQEGVVPDIQTNGKGLAGGYMPASGLLASRKIVDAMEAAGAFFNHGHTYQNHPVAAAAALTVQKIIKRDALVENVRKQGILLEKLLKKHLGDHPNVGDIRGRGLFWGIELVRDKETKVPFPVKWQVSRIVHLRALASPHEILLYWGQGCAGDQTGDHMMIMPAYTVTETLLETMVEKTAAAIKAVMEEVRSRS